MGIMSLAFSTLMVASKGAYDSMRAGPMPFVAEEPLERGQTRPVCETQKKRLLAATATAFAKLEDVDVCTFSMADLDEEDAAGQTLRMRQCGALELSCKNALGKPVVFERLDDRHFYARSRIGSGFIVLKCVD